MSELFFFDKFSPAVSRIASLVSPLSYLLENILAGDQISLNFYDRGYTLGWGGGGNKSGNF